MKTSLVIYLLDGLIEQNGRQYELSYKLRGLAQKEINALKPDEIDTTKETLAIQKFDILRGEMNAFRSANDEMYKLKAALEVPRISSAQEMEKRDA